MRNSSLEHATPRPPQSVHGKRVLQRLRYRAPVGALPRITALPSKSTATGSSTLPPSAGCRTKPRSSGPANTISTAPASPILSKSPRSENPSARGCYDCDLLLSDDFFIDPDLVEAACLSHDLGHPPFGHAGERTLNHLLAGSRRLRGQRPNLPAPHRTHLFRNRGRNGPDPRLPRLDSEIQIPLVANSQDGEPPPHNHFIYDSQTRLSRLDPRRTRLPRRTDARSGPRRLQIHRMPDHGLGRRHRLLPERPRRQRPRRISPHRENRNLGCPEQPRHRPENASRRPHGRHPPAPGRSIRGQAHRRIHTRRRAWRRIRIFSRPPRTATNTAS